MNTSTSRGSISAALIAALAISFFTGYDIQLVAVTAPRIIDTLGMSSKQMGSLFAASNLGLFFGSLIGGRLGDRSGYRNVLLCAVAIFGAFTLLTAALHEFVALTVVRTACGFGFGCALPNLLNVGTLLGSQQARYSVTATIFWAIPLGGLVAAGVAWQLPPDLSWIWPFIAGGVLSLVCIAFGAITLPGGSARKSPADPGQGILSTLFGKGRSITTGLIWLTFISSYVASYVASNWFPVLAMHRGISREHAPLTLVAFSVFGIFGTLVVGRMADRYGPRWPISIAWIITAAALVLLSFVKNPNVIFPVAATVGFAATGACISLYALTTFYYPPGARGLGSGAGIGAARVGAIAGPLYAGFLLDDGFSVNQIVLVPAIFAVIATIAIGSLSFRPTVDA
jgi:MFS transporter, AAHS family, 3-hydroxyphenylpropionic acid transporter